MMVGGLRTVHSWNEQGRQCLENGDNPCAGPTSVEFSTFWDKEILNLSEFGLFPKSHSSTIQHQDKAAASGNGASTAKPHRKQGEFLGDPGCSHIWITSPDWNTMAGQGEKEKHGMEETETGTFLHPRKTMLIVPTEPGKVCALCASPFLGLLHQENQA